MGLDPCCSHQSHSPGTASEVPAHRDPPSAPYVPLIRIKPASSPLSKFSISGPVFGHHPDGKTMQSEGSWV